MKKLSLITIGILLFLLTGGTALAMSSSSYQLPWSAASAGGGEMGSSSYVLRGTAGGTATGVSQSPNNKLEAGFWYGTMKLAETPVVVLPGDANGDSTINVLDMTKVARIILLMDPENPAADANQDGDINVLDMTKIARIILLLD